MDILKCTSYKIFILYFISFAFIACSQERHLKNEIYVYHWNDKDPIKIISLTEVEGEKKIKTYDQNIEIKKQYDSLNKTAYLQLVFKDVTQFQLNKDYELKINTSSYRINDFKMMSKNQGGNIMYTINNEPQEIGDDNIIKIEAGK
ncbi:hypothetical protein NZD88_11005 [Chryseobacterium antibioticum]|uniref:Lipoprotein n=1 Tax=Chryseobacterium pyrolae TaxID=2987481 RepID=A0ABT2II94_9FLAO|nr:hypothetical protein [Chryseobacterium pyrolae]MCT2408068.1 hypothetical protein [Chryseobacterium pyrolae]